MNKVTKKLIQQWQQEFVDGDERAYQRLFHQMYNPLLIYGKTMTPDQDIIEDQIQEVFIWLYNHPHQCRAIDNLESYLYLALKKNILLSLRRQTNQQNRERIFGKDQIQPTLCAEDQWVQSDTQQQQYQWLARQIDQLPPRMKEVVYLRYYQCLGFDEIAGIMSVSPQAARNFAFRAIKKIRQTFPQLQRLLFLMLTALLAG